VDIDPHLPSVRIDREIEAGGGTIGTRADVRSCCLTSFISEMMEEDGPSICSNDSTVRGRESRT